jgi:hypothetical protein
MEIIKNEMNFGNLNSLSNKKEHNRCNGLGEYKINGKIVIIILDSNNNSSNFEFFSTNINILNIIEINDEGMLGEQEQHDPFVY